MNQSPWSSVPAGPHSCFLFGLAKAMTGPKTGLARGYPCPNNIPHLLLTFDRFVGVGGGMWQSGNTVSLGIIVLEAVGQAPSISVDELCLNGFKGGRFGRGTNLPFMAHV